MSPSRDPAPPPAAPLHDQNPYLIRSAQWPLPGETFESMAARAHNGTSSGHNGMSSCHNGMSSCHNGMSSSSSHHGTNFFPMESPPPQFEPLPKERIGLAQSLKKKSCEFGFSNIKNRIRRLKTTAELKIAAHQDRKRYQQFTDDGDDMKKRTRTKRAGKKFLAFVARKTKNLWITVNRKFCNNRSSTDSTTASGSFRPYYSGNDESPFSQKKKPMDLITSTSSSSPASSRNFIRKKQSPM